MNGSLFRGGLALTMACAVWGGLYVVSKAVMAVWPPLPLVWLRFLMSACLMAFASLFFFIQPLTGTVSSHFFLGEVLTARLFAGGLLILVGVCGAVFSLPADQRQGLTPLDRV
ncbi:MAG TPA: hypothetical protein VMW83_02180 [Spirochaetia bacterium]|nr:hypothetical protein [Spirochaetia bacterium]